MRTDIIASKYGKIVTLKKGVETEIGELRGIYSVYINNTGGKAKFEFDGISISNAISDQYNWVEYNTSAVHGLSVYVKGNKVMFRCNHQDSLYIYYTVI